MYYRQEKLASLSKTKLRSMSEELTLPFGSEISKDNLVMNLSNKIINNEDGTTNPILALVEMEEENTC